MKKARRAARKQEKHRRAGTVGNESEDDLKYSRQRSLSPVRKASNPYNHSRTSYGGDDDEEYGPYPFTPEASSSRTRQRRTEEAEEIRKRLEEERFAEKMRDAMEDDGLYNPTQRLDRTEARLNSYAHVPRRWRGTDEGFSAGLWMEDAREDIGLEPWQMNDDEYAEYVRAGMWRYEFLILLSLPPVSANMRRL